MLKAALQGVAARLPASQRINGLLQRLTGSLELTDEHFLHKWQQAQRHLGNIVATSSTPRCAVELGTGWYPTVPVGLALGGVDRVLTIDLEPLFDRERTLAVLRRYRDFIASGRIEVAARASARLDQVVASAAGMSATELLEAIGVESLLVDARATGLPDASVDLFVSNNTLEHIGGVMLEQIFVEFARIAGPGASMSHFIDMADHYAGFDPSITVFNFLRYEPRVWSLFNNRLQYQNRLRLSQYLEIHETAGWAVTTQDVHREPIAVLREVPISSSFCQFSEEDLRASKAWVGSQRSRPEG